MNEREVLARSRAFSIRRGWWVMAGRIAGTHCTPARCRRDLTGSLRIMNSRLIGLLAGERQFWPLAGDQLYVDLDLSAENLPPGTRLAIGSAVLEITTPPHTGCKKFSGRFGLQASGVHLSSRTRKGLRLRGLNAQVVQPGVLRVGDRVQKMT